jgi:hypothetical protein
LPSPPVEVFENKVTLPFRLNAEINLLEEEEEIVRI